MRAIILVCLLDVAVPGDAVGAVFFSEYVEGSASNKGLEIFNFGLEVFDLAAETCAIEIFFNGSILSGATINLSGSIQPLGTHVVVDTNASFDGDQVADLTFNGNDAVVLTCDGVVRDVIGQIGVNPGSEWTSDGVSTQDQTLRREAEVCMGDADGGNEFFPSSEWDGFAQDSADGLGSHITVCDLRQTIFYSGFEYLDLYYDLAVISEDPIPGWTTNPSAGGSRTGVSLDSAGAPRFYTRNDAALDVGNREAWQIEAVLSAGAIGAPGEKGARMWVRFLDPDLPPIPPLLLPRHRRVEIRLMEALGERRIALFDGVNGSELTSLKLDWAKLTPRYRVRLKRWFDGNDHYIYLQADDRVNYYSQRVPLSSFGSQDPPAGDFSEWGFGNVLSDITSSWESIRVTRGHKPSSIIY